MQPPTSHLAQERSAFALMFLLGLATFILYLLLGVYYVTGPISPFHDLRLGSSGDAFLVAFPGWNGPQEFDDAAYNRAATEILRTGIPRERAGALFFHAPIYAYFVAGCYWLGGCRLLALAIPQAFLAALTCGAISLATYRIARTSRVAASLLAGFLFLINLRLAMYVGYVSPTILLLFLFSLAVLATAQKFSSARLCVFVGIIILAIGTQASFFVVAGAAGIWLSLEFWRSRTPRLIIAALIIFLFVTAKPLLPTLLKQDAQGSLNAAAESVLWEANNPYYESMTPVSLWERRPTNRWTHWKMSASEQERYDDYLERSNGRTTQAALLWIRENPGHYLKLAFVRLWTTLGPFTGMMSPRNRTISAVVWFLVFPAGCYGWWLSRNLPAARLAALVAVALTAFSSLIIVEWYLRYRFPVDLLMNVFAGIGYANLLMNRFSRRREVPQSLAT